LTAPMPTSFERVSRPKSKTKCIDLVAPLTHLMSVCRQPLRLRTSCLSKLSPPTKPSLTLTPTPVHNRVRRAEVAKEDKVVAEGCKVAEAEASLEEVGATRATKAVELAKPMAKEEAKVVAELAKVRARARHLNPMHGTIRDVCAPIPTMDFMLHAL